MKSNKHEINGYIYVTSEEKVTKQGIWARCNFTGDISKNRNGQINYKVILTSNPKLNEVQQLSTEEVEYLKSVDSFEVVDDTLTVKEMSSLPLGTRNHKYKIIIQKEEPKQETLEEYATKEVLKSTLYGSNKAEIGSSARSYFETELRNWIDGYNHAKQTLYTEDEVYNILVEHTIELFKKEPQTLDNFFNKHKKQ